MIVNPNTKNRFQGHAYTMLIWFLICLFLGKNTVSALSERVEPAQNYAASVIYGGDFSNDRHMATTLPVEQEAQSESQEVQDVHEKAEQEWNQFGLHSPYQNPLSLFSKLRCTSTHFTRSLQKRTSIPLFLLHHAWKSFLIG